MHLDATKKLLFADDFFELVVTVHFVTKDIMSIITRCIKPGGYLIFETYSGVGENWMTLPQVGEIQKDLKNSFEILGCQERIVGPRKENVSAKILGKKLNG